jgi:hypothetical protein
MSDGSGPLPIGTPAFSHTATEQWQSFEMRMRHRRAERCRLRAETAFQAGSLDEAEAALAEAKNLEPDALENAHVEQLLSSPPFPRVRETPAPAHGIQLLPAAEHPAAAHGRRWLRAAAVILIAAAGAMWLASSRGSWPDIASYRGRDVAGAPLTDLNKSVPSAVRPVDSFAVARAQGAPAGGSETTAPASETTPPPTPGESLPASQLDGPPNDNVTTRAVTEPPTSTEAASRAAPSPIVPPVVDAVSASPATVASSGIAPVREPVSNPPLREAASNPPEPVSNPPAGAPDAMPGDSVPVATPPPAAVPKSEPVDEMRPVRSALSRYEAAYSSLDAAAAGAVWPGVNRRELARAFDSLQSQRISLGDCDVKVKGATARAECVGSATWTPKVGGGARTQPRAWTFELAKDEGTWLIRTATVR